jgi:hypothetical protein
VGRPVASGDLCRLLNWFPAATEASIREVTFNLVSGGALLGGKETLTGLGDGVVDAPVLALTYNPAQLPTSQLVAELAMLSGNPLAVAAAVTEFTLLHCAPCLHGNTLGALSVGGNPPRRKPYGPFLLDEPKIEPCFAYRDARDGESAQDYAARAANALEEKILELGPESADAHCKSV